MSEEKERKCDDTKCDADCENCEKATRDGIDIDKLGEEDLRTLCKTQSDLVKALVDENETLIKEQKELNKKIEKGNGYLDQLTHMKSDFENFKRRTNAARDNSKDEGKIFVIEKILPVLDTFDRAQQSLKGKPELEAFNMVHRQFDKALKEMGLEEVEVLGETFDPNLSYAIAKEEAGEENVGKVVEVMSKGYKFKDKIVRYSQVKVGC